MVASFASAAIPHDTAMILATGGDGQVMSAGQNLRTRTEAFSTPYETERARERGLAPAASACISRTRSGTCWKNMRVCVALLLVLLFNLICSPAASEEEEDTGRFQLGILVDFSGHSSTRQERLEVSLLLGATLVPHGYPHTFSARVRPEDLKRARLLGPRVRVQMRHASDKLESRLLPHPSSRRAPDDDHACDLFVMLSGLPTHPAEELARQWYHQLRGAAVQGAVAMRAASDRKLRVTCARCRECTGAVARWLAAQQETEWVEQVRGLAFRNRMASAALEWGDRRCSGQQGALRRAGLSGEGEVVAIADSGIDLDHCMFRDALPTPVNSFDGRKRKVVSYFRSLDCASCGACDRAAGNASACGDIGDALRGHGTHVAGTAAGRVDCSPYATPSGALSVENGSRASEGPSCSAEEEEDAARFDALAYKARVAFTDVAVLPPPNKALCMAAWMSKGS